VARGLLLSAGDVAHCPHRVALERGGDPPGEPAPPATEILRRIREATAHRERVTAQLRRAHPDLVVAGGPEATEAAARAGVALIAQGRLADAPARRAAGFDLLVRVDAGGAPHYAPVLVKNNEITEPASTRRLREGRLEAPRPADAGWTNGVGVRRNDTMRRNGLALAHATRVLEGFDLADPAHYGGLIDRQGRLFWFDLDNREWGRWRLGEYDEAYAQRRAVLLGHERWSAGEGPFPTSPFWHRDCPTCPFHERCESELERTDDVSLIRFTSFSQQVALREHGVSTRAALAKLDPALAAAARGRVFSLREPHAPEEHLGRSIDKLDELIYRARSVLAGSPLLKVPAGQLSCPTADVEIDVDMESYDDVTYLWGALVSVRRAVPGVVTGYHAFVDWGPLDGYVESSVFSRFWSFFDAQRSAAAAAGASFAAYCFWAQAENGAMNRASAHPGSPAPTREEVDRFRQHQPSQWIDLHEVVRQQIQTDGPLGLKSLAHAAGFAWRDENPSGEASMTWYEEATGEGPGAEPARQRLLAYNEDDCRATRALREWLNGAARSLPDRDARP
jgi:predicted RecB family nuclease